MSVIYIDEDAPNRHTIKINGYFNSHLVLYIHEFQYNMLLN